MRQSRSSFVTHSAQLLATMRASAASLLAGVISAHPKET
jgi:hypothetical protein